MHVFAATFCTPLRDSSGILVSCQTAPLFHRLCPKLLTQHNKGRVVHHALWIFQQLVMHSFVTVLPEFTTMLSCCSCRSHPIQLRSGRHPSLESVLKGQLANLDRKPHQRQERQPLHARWPSRLQLQSLKRLVSQNGALASQKRKW